jgi:S1-C subfamily serine protease
MISHHSKGCKLLSNEAILEQRADHTKTCFVEREKVMNRYCWFIVTGVLFSSPVSAADEVVPEKKLELLKAATVYVKVEAKQGTVTGTGFLIQADGETGLVATNRHLVATVPGRFAPTRYTLVFWSGTGKEQVLTGEVVAVDPDQDLAILRVISKKLPTPLELAPAKLRETMTIFSLGFPPTDILATNRANPIANFVKGTSSNLQKDNRGKLKYIPLDEELNPGNSGGPVVDAEGKLVGIAVSKTEGMKISYVIPAVEMTEMLKGRAAAVVLRSVDIENDSAELGFEIPLIDPMRKIKTLELRYVRRDGLKELPQVDMAGNWSDLPGAEIAPVKIDNGKAVGRITLRGVEKRSFEFCFQSAYSIGAGMPIGTRLVTQRISFTQVGHVKLDGPPAWLRIASKEGGFSVDMPARPVANESTTEKIGSIKVHSLLLSYESENVTLLAYRIDLPMDADEKFHETLRDFFAEIWHGKVIGEKSIRSQGHSGHEFTIRGKSDDKTLSSICLREYMVGKSIFVVVVISPNAELPEDTQRFLGSLMLMENPTVAATKAEPEPKGIELKGWGLAIDPDNDCKIIPGEKSITFQVPATLHDLYFAGGPINAPRVMREVEGDFVVKVKVCGDFNPGSKSTNPKTIPYMGGGILLWNDSNNNLRFERFSWVRGEKITTGAFMEAFEGGRKGPNPIEQFPAGDCYLRLERKGNRIVGAISDNGTNWKELKAIDALWPAKIKVGLAAINTSNEAFSVKFEEFELKQKP